jgi:hypothetical protein
MTLPPQMPLYRRLAIFGVLLVILIAVASLRGAAPMFRKWAGDWTSQPR